MKTFGKNLSLKKRSNPINEKEVFCDIIDTLEENTLRLEKLYNLGLDLINYEDTFYLVIESLLRMQYGDWKTDIIQWYLYERKDYKTGEIGMLEWSNEETNETKEVTVKCSSDLWDILKEIESSGE